MWPPDRRPDRSAPLRPGGDARPAPEAPVKVQEARGAVDDAGHVAMLPAQADGESIGWIWGLNTLNVDPCNFSFVNRLQIGRKPDPSMTRNYGLHR